MSTTTIPPKQRRQGLHADVLGDLLDSATNAAEVGQQQFFTPRPHATAFATALPRDCFAIADLSCGDASLLLGVRDMHRQWGGQSLEHEKIPLLGLDIQQPTHPHLTAPIGADLTKAYSLLVETEWKCDLIVGNPPFSLRWHTDRLAGLADSHSDAVQEVWRKLRNKRTIDSTLASLLIYIDRLSRYGEGFMVCNAASARRLGLLPDDETPASPLAAHIWLTLTVPGFFPDVELPEVAIIYFAAAVQPFSPACLTAEADPASIMKALYEQRHHRAGPYVRRHCETSELCVSTWRAVAQELAARKAEIRSDWNIYLDRNGCFRTHLTPFDLRSDRVDKATAQGLDDLSGRSPMELVVQKSTRAALKSAVLGTIWRVHPDCIAAVERALAEYDAVRAPFYPLNEVQSLGYLDEEDTILCKKSFGSFTAGERYHVTTQTVPITRRTNRPNINGELEAIQTNGQELQILISPNGKGGGVSFVPDPDPLKDSAAEHHPLTTLLAHFTVPQVADLATAHPDRYAAALGAVDALQELLS